MTQKDRNKRGCNVVKYLLCVDFTQQMYIIKVKVNHLINAYCNIKYINVKINRIKVQTVNLKMIYSICN